MAALAAPPAAPKPPTDAAISAPDSVKSSGNRMNSVEDRMKELCELFRVYGNRDYIGEPVSQAQHMCQAAWFARENFPEDVELKVGMLLHVN
jgi:hypothetical protein